MKKQIFYILTSTLLTFNAYADDKDGIAAIVNGKQIKVEDIKTVYNLHPKTKEKVSFEEFYNNVLDFLIESEVIYQAAQDEKISDTPEYTIKLSEAKKELARQIYLKKKAQVAINDKAVKKLYEDYKETFHGEKEVKAKHILVDSETKAKEVIAKLNDAGQFDKLAKEYSKEPADLGYFTKEMMVPEFANAAFSMKKGQFSKTPVKTQFGYHVILVEDIREAKPEDFEKIEPQLRAVLTKKVMSDIMNDLYNKAKIIKYDISGNQL